MLESQVTGDVAQNTGMREQREQVQLQEAKRASLRAELAEARHAHQQDQVLLRQLQKDWTTAGQARATVEQERATVAQRLATVCDELDKERAKVTVLYQENSQLQFKVQAIEEELVKVGSGVITEIANALHCEYVRGLAKYIFCTLHTETECSIIKDI